MSTRLQLVGILVVLGFAGTAAAEVDASISVVPGQGAAAPQIEAIVRGGPRLPLGQIMLRDPRGVVVPATEVIDFQHGKQLIAVAIVVEGGEIWLGNDDFEPEDSPARYPGALKGIQRGIDALDLANTMPAGSLGTVITYDERVRVRQPLGPIAGVTGRSLGSQKDYYGRLGQSLVQATSLALGELEQAPTHRKLLLVISDGNDTNNDAAKAQFAELKKLAAQGGIQVAAIRAVGDHITQGTVKLNDTYFTTASYNTPAWRNLVMCQEVGHTFGLDHQDEDFGNTPLGTCMDYSDDPDPNQHPNSHDYEQLELIYDHVDATATIGVSTVPDDVGDTPAGWGERVWAGSEGRNATFVRDFGAGRHVITFVTWAEPQKQ